MTVSDLSGQLEYQFCNEQLLVTALTHRSAGHHNNERLEFLGDSVLGLVVSETLFARYPDASEGDLSRLRANLVNGQSLASIAKELSLGDYLILGPGELKSGGFRRESILADAMEAIIGAILLDSNYLRCKQFVLSLLHQRLENIPAVSELKDPKTRLQEYLQSRKHELPVYHIQSVTGKAHNQQFVVECTIDELQMKSQGTGGSRRKAEQQAAEKMVTLLENKA